MLKHILISLCGMSPAVMTETVYCLGSDVPDELIAISTKSGAGLIRKELFDNGVWRDLQSSHPKFRKIKFSNNSMHVRVLQSSQTAEDADDITEDSDCVRMTDDIMRILRQYTENPDTKITFSISGGRKTMSVAGALAMSMIGRKQDCLCHVLVDHPYDSPELTPRFYYPKCGLVHTLQSGGKYSSAHAKLKLCRIPFVRQRYLFEDKLNRLPGDYCDMVELLNGKGVTENAGGMLKLIPSKNLCVIENKEIRLNDFEFTIIWLLALRKLQGQPYYSGTLEMHEDYVDFAEEISSRIMPSIVSTRDILLRKDSEDLRRPISSINKKIQKACGYRTASAYSLSIEKGVYGLSIAKANIIVPNCKDVPETSEK